MARSALLLAAVVLAGCGDNGGARPSSAAAPNPSAGVPSFTRPEKPAAAAPTAEEPAAEQAAEPDSAEPSEKAAEASATEALPDVEVTNIGMHIGGEKNTEDQKKPIREAVREHYDAMRRCYAETDRPKETTFGVDMRIGEEGGPARITNPRSGFGRDATNCLVDVMKAVEFPKPSGGVAQMVSFSLRFRRK